MTCVSQSDKFDDEEALEREIAGAVNEHVPDSDPWEVFEPVDAADPTAEEPEPDKNNQEEDQLLEDEIMGIKGTGPVGKGTVLEDAKSETGNEYEEDTRETSIQIESMSDEEDERGSPKKKTSTGTTGTTTTASSSTTSSSTTSTAKGWVKF